MPVKDAPGLFAATGVLIVVGWMVWFALDGCALHNPVDVQPDYPITTTVADAGRG